MWENKSFHVLKTLRILVQCGIRSTNIHRITQLISVRGESHDAKRSKQKLFTLFFVFPRLFTISSNRADKKSCIDSPWVRQKWLKTSIWLLSWCKAGFLALLRLWFGEFFLSSFFTIVDTHNHSLWRLPSTWNNKFYDYITQPKQLISISDVATNHKAMAKWITSRLMVRICERILCHALSNLASHMSRTHIHSSQVILNENKSPKASKTAAQMANKAKEVVRLREQSEASLVLSVTPRSR